MPLSTYHSEVNRLYRFLVPPGERVLELGCRDGALLASLMPSTGVGVDVSEDAIHRAQETHRDRSELTFRVGNVDSMDFTGLGAFDYIIIPDVVVFLRDVQAVLSRLRPLCAEHARLILNSQSNVWRPMLSLATALGLRRPVRDINWLSTADLRNLLYLAGFEVVQMEGRILLPLPIPGLNWLSNRLLAKLPGFRWACMTWCLIARPIPGVVPLQPSWGSSSSEPRMTRLRPAGYAAARANERERGELASIGVHSRFDCLSRGVEPGPSVSVLIPTRNEKGNIEDAFRRTPCLGIWTELVFVDGHSSDGTQDEIRRCMEKYRAEWPRVKLVDQTGKGKGQAVRQGFDECEGEVLMILDSDLTMPPEELPKYYDALVSGRGDFINGCRLVYPQEDKAMRFLNMIANGFFARAFTWLLGQSVKDTLCGTKVLWRRDYLKIKAHRGYFGDFDPFGDFDLLFGAAKLNRRIVDVPIRYRARTYGDIKIDRWRDGMLLLRMCFIAFRRFKLA